MFTKKNDALLGFMTLLLLIAVGLVVYLAINNSGKTQAIEAARSEKEKLSKQLLDTSERLSDIGMLHEQSKLDLNELDKRYTSLEAMYKQNPTLQQELHIANKNLNDLNQRNDEYADFVNALYLKLGVDNADDVLAAIEKHQADLSSVDLAKTIRETGSISPTTNDLEVQERLADGSMAKLSHSHPETELETQRPALLSTELSERDREIKGLKTQQTYLLARLKKAEQIMEDQFRLLAQLTGKPNPTSSKDTPRTEVQKPQFDTKNDSEPKSIIKPERMRPRNDSFSSGQITGITEIQDDPPETNRLFDKSQSIPADAVLIESYLEDAVEK